MSVTLPAVTLAGKCCEMGGGIKICQSLQYLTSIIF